MRLGWTLGIGVLALGVAGAAAAVVGAQLLAFGSTGSPGADAALAGGAALAVTVVAPLYLAAQVIGTLGDRARNRPALTLATLLAVNAALLGVALGLARPQVEQALNDHGTWFLAGHRPWEEAASIPVESEVPAVVPVPMEAPAPAPVDEGPWNAKRVFAERSGSIVMVRVWMPPGDPELAPLLGELGLTEVEGLGSGFAVGPELVITNHHVIGTATRAEVVLPGGTRVAPVEVLALDPTNDLALVRVPGANLTPVPLADRPAEVGDPCYAIGAPLGMEETLTEGIVSARRELRGTKVVQMQTPIAPGSSGGPLLDAHGAVLGVNTATLGAAGMYAAIDLEHVRALLELPRSPNVLEGPPSELVLVDLTVDGQLLPTDREQVAQLGSLIANAGGHCYGALPADARVELSEGEHRLRLSSTNLGPEVTGCLQRQLEAIGPFGWFLARAAGTKVNGLDFRFEQRGSGSIPSMLTLHLTLH